MINSNGRKFTLREAMSENGGTLKFKHLSFIHKAYNEAVHLMLKEQSSDKRWSSCREPRSFLVKQIISEKASLHDFYLNEMKHSNVM